MRYFGTAGVSSPWMRRTKSFSLGPGAESELLDLGRPSDARVPFGAVRLVVTLWWLEVNTGEAEQKMEVDSILMVPSGIDKGYVVKKSSGLDNCIRFHYDCTDESGTYERPPRGEVARDVPQRPPDQGHEAFHIALLPHQPRQLAERIGDPQRIGRRDRRRRLRVRLNAARPKRLRPPTPGDDEPVTRKEQRQHDKALRAPARRRFPLQTGGPRVR